MNRRERIFATLNHQRPDQHTLPFGTVEDVRQEVVRLIEKCGYSVGLVLRPSNVISFDTPIENVLAFFETARDYR